MRLIIETGQGLPDANTYIEEMDIEKYLPSTVLTNWNELSEDEKIDRLMLASLFIDISFNWKGQQKTLDQGLSWPRTCVYFQGHVIPDDYIPRQIKRACVMAISLIMEFGIGVFQDTGEVQVKKEKLGPIETEYFEALKVQSLNSSEYTDMNNMLRGFYRSPNSGVVAVEVLRK